MKIQKYVVKMTSYNAIRDRMNQIKSNSCRVRIITAK